MMVIFIDLRFQTTYEELKLHQSIDQEYNTTLPDYLWGIETSLKPKRRFRYNRLPDYLWGIETRILFKLPFSESIGASRLPMRNWNISSRWVWTCKRGLPDYLWGIETKICWSRPATLEGFQTTYEELKQERLDSIGKSENASRLPMRNWNSVDTRNCPCIASFQTTYEELKRSRRMRFSLSSRCFQTTYEELKRFVKLFLEFYHVASRLPMRNWNTILWATLRASSIELPDYLWGIETEVLSFFRQSWYLRFQTTYEELKQRRFRQFLYIHQGASRLPMRNWNSDLVKKTGLLKRLPDYLWGIETLEFNIDDPLFVASRLPMRNWNSNLNGNNFHRFSASRLPMRNWNRSLTRKEISFTCFQTTYEELKRPYVVHQPSEDGASRLPMRNWNFGSGRCRFRLGCSLPDYLWGIETHNYRNIDNHQSGFQTTYEELKQSCDLPTFGRRDASRLPMRNWNRWELRVMPIRHLASRLPMRNWNQFWKHLSCIHRASRLPMRNWNSQRIFQRRSVAQGFQTTYEELKRIEKAS